LNDESYKNGVTIEGRLKWQIFG